MRRVGVGVLLGVSALALAGLATTTLTDDRKLAFTLGVQPTLAAAVLSPGAQACQGPVSASESAGSVRFPVGTFGLTAPELEVSVRDASGRRLSTSRVAGGYRHDSTVGTTVQGVRDGSVIVVCVRNIGRNRIALNGGPAQAARTSGLEVGGTPVGADMALVFERSSATSMAALISKALDRAALFKAGWVSPGLLTALGIAFLVGVPGLLALALAGAEPRAGGRSSRPGLPSD